MVTKNEVKYIQSLSHKKTRNETGLFVAEGPKIIEELLRSNFIIQKIFATKDWIDANNIFNAAEINQTELEKISNLTTPNKVLAVVEQKKTDNKKIVFESKIILALDGIQDPGNLGTIIRTAHWFGVDTILASENSVDLYNLKVVQSTMGSIGKVDVIYGDLKSVFKNCRVKIFGASLNGKNIKSFSRISEGIIVIGNEGSGISIDVSELIDEPVKIEGKSDAESLNAAVAAGILLAHFV